MQEKNINRQVNKKDDKPINAETMSVSAALQKCSKEMLEEKNVKFTFRTKKGDFYHIDITVEQIQEFTDENGITWERRK